MRNRMHYGRTLKKSWQSPLEYRMLNESFGILNYRDSSLDKSLSSVIEDIYNEHSCCVYDCVIDNGSSEISIIAPSDTGNIYMKSGISSSLSLGVVCRVGSSNVISFSDSVLAVNWYIE